MDIKELVRYLRSSLKLQDPEIVTDEAYRYTDEELEDVLRMLIPAQNPSYTEKTFPKNEEHFLILLAKKEIYYRLATATAPLYPLSAEGAELRKDVRFDHYMSLIRSVESEYSLSWSMYESTKEIQVSDVFLERNHFTLRNYENAHKPIVELSVDNVTQTSIDISWNKFTAQRGKFAEYKVYIGTSPIYDEYEDIIDPEAKLLVTITDIHKTKYRIKGLDLDTKYYVGVVSVDVNKLKGVYFEEVTTLPIEPEPEPEVPEEPTEPTEPTEPEETV